MDVVYLNYTNAFAKVENGILGRKLEKVGITGPLSEWLCSFDWGEHKLSELKTNSV